MNQLGLFEQRGGVFVNSIDIARVFGKRHDNVLRDIDNLKIKCSPAFFIANFEETLKRNEQNGESYRTFNMTKDGFVMLVMGYTGKLAMRFKEKYIAEFNRTQNFMRQRASAEWIEARNSGKQTRRTLTDKLKAFIEEHTNEMSENERKFLYNNVTRAINKSLGISAGQRDNLPPEMLKILDMCEEVVGATVGDTAIGGEVYGAAKNAALTFAGAVQPVLKVSTPKLYLAKE